MRLPEICIQRPVFATVLSVIVLLVGLISYSRLSVREYPRIDEPVVSVETVYQGASAEVVESQITKVLEDSLSGIEGVELMTSSSRSERSQITVRFRLSRDPDSAAADVRDKVARVRGRLPEAVDEPVIAKVEADSFPIIWIAVSAPGKSQIEASDYASRYIRPRLSTLPGAADVRIFGERRISMRIWVDRAKLAAYRLTVQDVEDALRRQNVEIPAGRIESDKREFSVLSLTDLQTPQQFEAIVVREVSGYPVRIRDLGRVEVAPLEERVITRFMGSTSVTLGVIKQAVANPLELSQAVRKEIVEINKTLDGMKLELMYDSSVFIEQSIKAVFTHDRRGDRAGGPGDLRVPAQPARHHHPARHDPGLARRRVHVHVRVRLQREHAHAARAGARDRPGGRRRDRGAREHLPQPRERHVAPGRGAHGREGDRLRRGRHDDDAGRRLRAARVRHRPHGQALHRVRAGARRRGAGVGLRRPHALAR